MTSLGTDKLRKILEEFGHQTVDWQDGMHGLIMHEKHLQEAIAEIDQLLLEARREALMKWDVTNLTGTYDSAILTAFNNGGYTVKLPDCNIEVDEKNKVVEITALKSKVKDDG